MRRADSLEKTLMLGKIEGKRRGQQTMRRLDSITVQWTCCCSVTQSCLMFCDPMDSSTPGFLVFHYVPGFAQTHVHGVSDATQPSHPLLPASPPTLTLSQHQGLSQWACSSHQVSVLLSVFSSIWYSWPVLPCWEKKKILFNHLASVCCRLAFSFDLSINFFTLPCWLFLLCS